MAKKILIVDDEADIVRLLQTRLEANGYEVSTAGDGRSGLERMEGDRPDLILLDVMMPRMDGFSFVKELRKQEHQQAVPIIVLTAKEMMSDIFKMEGVSDYIVKPFETEQLLATIQKYV